ncbi:MAG TPA: hypothetical protein ENG50_03655, partial [Candidatus Altiarchaeales archaeon]|nr:hypothetical protein [Candidatus Altiarchaeales archaeon]
MNKGISITTGTLVVIILLLGVYVIHVYKPTVPVKEQLEEEAKKKLSQVKVAILYQRVTDGVYYLNRSVDDVINILKET